MTCCINLRGRRLVDHSLRTILGFLIVRLAYLLKRRSCKEAPDSCLVTSCIFSPSREFDSFPFSLSRLLSECSLSDDTLESSGSPETAMTGTGSSRLMKASAVYSSMFEVNRLMCLDWEIHPRLFACEKKNKQYCGTKARG